MRCYYVAGSYDQDDGYIRLQEKTAELGLRFGTAGNLVFHIATPPSLYAATVSFLGKNGLVSENLAVGTKRKAILEIFSTSIPRVQD